MEIKRQVFYQPESLNIKEGLYHINDYYQRAFEWFMDENFTSGECNEIMKELADKYYQQEQQKQNFNLSEDIVSQYNAGSPPHDSYVEDPQYIYEESYPMNANYDPS